MTTYFITRHPGAQDWVADQGIVVDVIRQHLDIARVQPGDIVIGTLPVHLAAQVCAHGARYLHLALDLPPEARGRELNAEAMGRYNARLEAYRVERLAGDHP